MIEEFCAGELSLQFWREHLRAVLAFCWSKKASLITFFSSELLLPLLSGESKSARISAKGALGTRRDGRGEHGSFFLDLLSSSFGSPMNLTGVDMADFFMIGESAEELTLDMRCSVSGSLFLRIDFRLSALLCVEISGLLSSLSCDLQGLLPERQTDFQ